MLRLARTLALFLLFPSVLPVGRRLGVAPHGIALLLAAAVFLYSYPGSGPGPAPSAFTGSSSGATAECLVLEDFFETPQLVAEFKGSPAELQRWVDAYDQHCP